MDAALRADLASRGVSPECQETIELVRDVLTRVGDKWTILVIGALAPGPLRFTALHRQIAGISHRMLSQTLRSLTRDGLVTRTAHAEMPPRVEYALTPLGRSLDAAVAGVVRWVQENQSQVVHNRGEFDRDESARGGSSSA
ncbi:helix-turn-helix transcriptional regulator [Yinghuangia sp. ASG 101]|uniref:winged helix-turn-helix transcriptional regulator n=1 Tax=Yinghuangia sp. ASG 101 TaxID=2896848 RepID=UPI001E38413C|nr:helix-turn-helix domain-containing protein [Yinghuangia sp. ASG 101]UGQ11539.1 helix-turn-helix transcriptional regulator [Yinghuangia sp. ASG 101]